MSSIFVKHFELPCVERCYINKLALPCLTCAFDSQSTLPQPCKMCVVNIAVCVSALIRLCVYLWEKSLVHIRSEKNPGTPKSNHPDH